MYVMLGTHQSGCRMTRTQMQGYITRRRVSRHLGEGTRAGQAIGTAIMQSAPATGPAAPFVLVAGALVSLFSKFFGGGCGQACVLSATAEQVPEVAMRDIHAVAQDQPGAISGPMFQAVWQQVQTYGIEKLQELQQQGDSRAADGIKNLQKSMDYTSFVAGLPASPTVAIDLAKAQNVFENVAAAGWEPGSVAAGNDLANQVLSQLAASTAVASDGVTSIGGGVVSALQQNPTLALAGAAVVGFFLIKGF